MIRIRSVFFIRQVTTKTGEVAKRPIISPVNQTTIGEKPNRAVRTLSVNGFKVTSYETCGNIPAAGISLVLPIGSRHETERTVGAAHYLKHVLMMVLLPIM